MFVQPYTSYGQKAETPTYKDGDFWKVRQEVNRGGGAQASGNCWARRPFHSTSTIKLCTPQLESDFIGIGIWTLRESVKFLRTTNAIRMGPR